MQKLQQDSRVYPLGKHPSLANRRKVVQEQECACPCGTALVQSQTFIPNFNPSFTPRLEPNQASLAQKTRKSLNQIKTGHTLQ